MLSVCVAAGGMIKLPQIASLKGNKQDIFEYCKDLSGDIGLEIKKPGHECGSYLDNVSKLS